MPQGPDSYPSDMQQPPQSAGPGLAVGEASPDEVMAAEQDASMQERQALSATAPMPEKPYSVKKVKSLFEEFKKTVKKLAGDKVPVDELTWEPPEGSGPKLEGPLPDPVFPAMVLIVQVVEGAGPEFGEKYTFDPMGLVDDSALNKAQAKIRMMGKDKKLKLALEGEGPEEEPAEEPAEEVQPAPEEMGADDEEIMSV